MKLIHFCKTEYFVFIAIYIFTFVNFSNAQFDNMNNGCPMNMPMSNGCSGGEMNGNAFSSNNGGCGSNCCGNSNGNFIIIIKHPAFQFLYSLYFL